MDLSQISAAISSVATATEIAKLIRASDLSLDKAETKMKLADLTDALANVKIQLADVKTLVLEKDARIESLEAMLVQRNNMVYDKPYYWLEDGPKKEGPFCQACYDSDSKLIRLQGRGRQGAWECRKCTNAYNDKSYTSPRKTRIVSGGPNSWMGR